MFRIGEFSKIAQVPASLLRYYNDIGLFVPIRSDRNTSYRYYSIEQIIQLNRILALKDLGLSLEQIKRMLEDNISAEEIRGMLTLKKVQIEQSIQAEAARLRAVESRLQQIEHKGEFQNDDVVLKSLPATPFLSLRQVYPDLAQTLAAISEIGKAVSKQIKAKSLDRFAAVIYGELYQERDWDLDFGFLLNQPMDIARDITVTLSSGLSMSVQELPPVATAVTAVRFGGPENGHLSYTAIGKWVEANQYRLVGPGREVFIVPPKAGHESEMVVEIQFPVEAIAR